MISARRNFSPTLLTALLASCTTTPSPKPTSAQSAALPKLQDRIATWQSKTKGIDDAALMDLPIAQISCANWLRSLPAPFRQQVIKFWRSQRIALTEI
jgi:hypothetical protein